VLNGDNGLSQKSAHVGNASYYYSISRWQTDGHLRLGKDEIKVSGLSWLDREWSSSALAADQQGWDWFALQLSDGSELMFYNLRKADGTRDVHSGGTWVAADGQSHHLDSDEVSILATSEWESPEGGTYPSGWDIHAPGLGLSLTVAPVLDDQELFTTVRYWEGAVDVTGTRNGAEVIGRGYVELTGYAD
jgi:predicted secreted hydrolase